MSPETIKKLDEIIRLHKSGMPLPKIAKKVGLSYPQAVSSLVGMLRKFGEDIPNRQGAHMVAAPKVTVKLSQEEIAEFEAFKRWRAFRPTSSVGLTASENHA